MRWLGQLSVTMMGLVISACMIAPPLYASACFDRAASTVTSEHLFSANPLPPLTDSEANDIRDILDSLRGHWTGVANGYWCLGTAQNPERIPDDYKVEAEVSVSGGQSDRHLRLNATLHSKQDNGMHQETLALFLKKSQFYIDTPEQADNPHMQERSITSSRISFAQMAYPPDAVRVIARSIEVHADSMILHTEVYTHNVLTSASVWRLSRANVK